MEKNIEDLLYVIISFLLEKNKENIDYWLKVKEDKDHTLNYVSYFFKKEKYLFGFESLETLKHTIFTILFSYLQRDLVTKPLLHSISTLNSEAIKADLLAENSFIFSSLSNILKIPLIFNNGRNNNTFFYPSSSCCKKGKPLMLYWNVDNDKINRRSSFSKPSYKSTDHLPKKTMSLSNSDSSDSENEKKLKSKRSTDISSTDLHLPTLKRKNSLDASIQSDLHLTDSDDDNKSERSDDANKSEPSVICSNEVKDLKTTAKIDSLFKDNQKKIADNLYNFLEITERMKNHALILQHNLLPENFRSCTCCPIHCGGALFKVTKNKRGPKKKKIL